MYVDHSSNLMHLTINEQPNAKGKSDFTSANDAQMRQNVKNGAQI